jgi:hypothetical protein
MGDLSAGVFGASTETSGVSYTTGGSTSTELLVTYNFAVSGVANGTAQFDISAPGIISCVECSGPQDASGMFIYGTGESISGVPISGALSNGANNLVLDTSIVNGTAQLFFGLETVTGCPGGPGYIGAPCTAISDFLDPMSITGASVYDANGNLVSGASLISDSGFNPNASSPPPVGTPEPSSVMMLGVGLLGLAGLTLKKSL